MTDKEKIMIDGVDVSGCDCLGHGLYLGKNFYPCTAVRYLYAPGSDSCYNFPNCSYKKAMKQLAHKTQEYNELLEQHKELDDRANRMIEEKYRLGRECEQIKEKYEALKLENQEGYEIVAELKHECEELKREIDLYKTWYRAKHDDIKNLLGSYRKALEEIEKLAIKTNRVLCNNCGWVNTISCIPSEYICGDIKQILDIINKAKGEV